MKITQWNRSWLCGAVALWLLSFPCVTAAEGQLHNDTSQSGSESGISLEQQFKQAFESAKQSLATYNDAKSKVSLLSEKIIGESNGVDVKLFQIQSLHDKIDKQKDAIDKGVRELNAKQIKALKKKVAVLLEREGQRRERQQERKEQLLAKQKRKKTKKRRKNKKSALKTAVKKEDLGKIVNVKEILAKSDSVLENWFIDLVNKEVASLKDELGEAVKEATIFDEVAVAVEEESPDAEDVDCSGARLADSVPLVQESLINYSHDKIGVQDHLQKATIVHHLTSDTYKPERPPQYRLGNQWWSQYIPDDIERVMEWAFPSWRQWNVALPDSVAHTLRLKGIGSTAPPEAVLSPNIHPGSCWPMTGHTGQVTFRLAYPLAVSSVTLDHVSALVVDTLEKRKSAPKKVRVVGFPPCRVADKSSDGSKTDDDYLDDYGKTTQDATKLGKCADGLDFDVQKPVLLHTFKYNLDGPSIQTFQIGESEDEDDAEEEEEDDEGTCSGPTSGTCGPGNLEMVGVLPEISEKERMEYIEDGLVAIRLEILENHGNADYTCIYRFRVHGEAVLD